MEGRVSAVDRLTAQAIVDPAAARSDIMHALRAEGGHRELAAERLGVSRRVFYSLLERLEMKETIADKWPAGGRKVGVGERW